MSFLRACIYIGPVSSKVTARQLTITDVTRVTAEEGSHIRGGVIYHDDVVFDQDVGLVDTVCVSLQKHAHYVIKLVDTFQGTLRTSRFRTHMYTTLAQKVASGGTRFPGQTYVGFVCIDEETSVSSQTATMTGTSVSTSRTSTSSSSLTTSQSSETSTLTSSLTSSSSSVSSVSSSLSTSSTKVVKSSSSPSTSMGQSATSISTTSSKTTQMMMSSSTSTPSSPSSPSSLSSQSSVSSVSSLSSVSTTSSSLGVSSETSSQMSEGLCSMFAARPWDEDEQAYIDSPITVSDLDGTDWEFECCLTWDETVYNQQQFHNIFSYDKEGGGPFTLEVDTGVVGGQTGAIRFSLGGGIGGVNFVPFGISGIEDNAEHKLELTFVNSTGRATLFIDDVELSSGTMSAPVYPSAGEKFRIGYEDSFVTGAENTPWDGEMKDVKLTKGGVVQFHYELRESNTGTNIPDIGGLNNDGTAFRFFLGSDFAIPAHGSVDLLDDFTTTEAAPLTDPRTCEPGPGTMDFSGTASSTDLSITGGQLYGDRGPADIDDNARFHLSPSLARTAGRRLEALLQVDESSQSDFQMSWVTALATTSSNDSGVEAGIRLVQEIPSSFFIKGWSTETGSAQMRNYADVPKDELATFDGELVFLSIVLRATGFHGFITYGGRLKHLGTFNEGTTTPLFPAVWFRNKDTRLSYIRVRQSLWTPTPICSDSFVRGDSDSVGSTDDLGAEESGGGTLAWTETAEASGNAEIVSNRSANTATGAGDNVFVTVEASQADVVIEADLYPSDFAAVVFRFIDSSNYMAVFVDVDADEFRLVKVVGGSSTTLDTQSLSFQSAGELSRVHVSADGGAVHCRLDGDFSTNRVEYVGTINELEGATKHGVYLDNEVGGVKSECSRLVIWRRNITGYT